MDQLWAPWRLSYVSTAKPPTTGKDCFLCQGLAATNDRENLIVGRTAFNVVVVNKYPYNNGHLLIAPFRHVGTFGELTADELLDAMQTMQQIIRVLDEMMRPDGHNVGLNLGKAAGAGLPDHLHWHVVPRWNGDTNFMPVMTDVRVIVQSLEAFYDLFAPRWTAVRR